MTLQRLPSAFVDFEINLSTGSKFQTQSLSTHRPQNFDLLCRNFATSLPQNASPPVARLGRKVINNAWGLSRLQRRSCDAANVFAAADRKQMQRSSVS